MKTLKQLAILIILYISFIGCTNSQPKNIEVDTSKTETYYFAVEIKDVLCGYSELKVSPMVKDSIKMTLIEGDVFVLLTLLGEGMDMEIQYVYYADTLETAYTYNEVKTLVGNTRIEASTIINGNTALIESTLSSTPKNVELPDDIILDTPIGYPHLIRDFINSDIQEKTYNILDNMKGEIVEKKYTRIGEEDIELADNLYHTVIFEELDLSSGLKTRLWIDPVDGLNYKASFVGGRVVYLSDQSVKKRITTANLDEVLFAKVNKIIPDIQKINYMKVEATIESVGEWLTAENLNYAGQHFNGTVTENLIEGIFEVEHTKYHGENAPPFPFDHTADTTLVKYLEPEDFIESDDPELIEKAKEITEGSKDSWDAAIRLSEWVGKNIRGAIPGGTTAKKTYETLSGECGSHSRLLAAFCRSVGIPARMVIGCMYTTHYGGSFGQHAWNEVYMGGNGWIPIDATAMEFDYIDCGHIKLGEKSSFNPKAMKILEFRVEGGTMEGDQVAIPEK